MSGMQHVEITGKAPAITLKLDGQSVPALSADLHVDARSLPLLTVDLDAMVLSVDIQGTAEVSQQTRDALIAMGWTPPAS